MLEYKCNAIAFCYTLPLHGRHACAVHLAHVRCTSFGLKAWHACVQDTTAKQAKATSTTGGGVHDARDPTQYLPPWRAAAPAQVRFAAPGLWVTCLPSPPFQHA